MLDLLIPGTKVVLKKVLKEKRKTNYDLIGVFHDNQLVSVDSRVPNKLILEALKNGDLKELSMYNVIKTEHKFEHSRFDFFLANEHERCLLEVKSSTLVKDGTALFPDATTERGWRQVKNLIKSKKKGYRACLIFVVQRNDAHTFSSNDEVDPEFGQLLRSALNEGVEVFAYYLKFFERRIVLKGKLKVNINP